MNWTSLTEAVASFCQLFQRRPPRPGPCLNFGLQLTLSQPGGQILPTTVLWVLSGLNSPLRPWFHWARKKLIINYQRICVKNCWNWCSWGKGVSRIQKKIPTAFMDGPLPQKGQIMFAIESSNFILFNTIIKILFTSCVFTMVLLGLRRLFANNLFRAGLVC